MRVDKILLVEAAANDLRGALTLVGVNQRVFFFPILPFRFQLRAVIMLTDEVEGSDGKEFEDFPESQLDINVIDPEGVPSFSWVEQIRLDHEKKWVDLPLLAAVVSDVTVSGNTHGVYVIEVRFSVPGQEEFIGRFPIYITPQPDTLTPESGIRAFSATDVNSH